MLPCLRKGCWGTVSICIPWNRPILVRLTHDYPWRLSPWSEHLFTLNTRCRCHSLGSWNERKLWRADSKFWWVSASTSTLFYSVRCWFCGGTKTRKRHSPEWRESKGTVHSIHSKQRTTYSVNTGYSWRKQTGSERRREMRQRQRYTTLLSAK